jgi:branched-chain amino acid transport system permease protein
VSNFILLTFTGIGVGSLYFLLASGLSLIFGLMKVLSFAHGAFLSACAYVAWEVITRAPSTSGWWLLVALIAGAVAGGVLALIVEVLVIRPLYGRELEQLLATVGVGIALVSLLEGIFGPDERLVQLPKWATDVTHIAGASVPNNRFLAIAAAAAMLIGVSLFLSRTRHGLIIRAGVENREMVQALGIDVRRSLTLVFALGGVAAGLAGGFGAIFYRSVNPLMGDQVLIFSFIVLVIGGLGSIAGAAIAAVVIGLVQSTANFYVANGMGDILAVVLLAVVLLIRPQGLLGNKERVA